MKYLTEKIFSPGRMKAIKTLLILLTLSFGLAVSALAQTGGITGKLTYPSDYIPPQMVLCVKNVNGGEDYCSNENAARLRKAKISFKLNYRAASYEVSLPAGTYNNYARFPNGKAPTPDDAE